jgi:hypothetical protein
MIGTNLAITPKRYVPLGGAATDTDAQAFITAAGITDGTQQSAVNQLVLDLKSANIWTKMKAVYPILGGTASTHKWNLKDPRDLDAAYRLTFATGWTHSSNGMLPNGTSAYANTFFIPSSNLTLYQGHLSYYSRTTGNPASTQSFMGNYNNTGVGDTKANFALIYTSAGSALSIQHSNAVASDYASKSSETSRAAFWMNNRTSSTATTLKIWKNGVAQANATTNSAGQILNTSSTYLGARRNTTLSSPQAESYTDAECAFASIGDGLTDTEAANFYTAVNTFQTTLGRNV